MVCPELPCIDSFCRFRRDQARNHRGIVWSVKREIFSGEGLGTGLRRALPSGSRSLIFLLQSRPVSGTTSAMEFVPRWCLVAAFCVLPHVMVAAQKPKKALDASSIEHMREELGINEFIAPSIELVFREL